jgi:hypothetical protein
MPFTPPVSHFDLLQEQAVAELSGDAFLSTTANGKTIPVLHERIGDLLSKLTAAISKVGVFLVVLTPVGTLRDPKARAIDLVAPLHVQIQENVLFNQGANGTKVSALALVSFVMRKLHFWTPQLYPGSSRATRSELDKTPFVLVTEDPILTYNVRLNVPINLSAPINT